MKNKKNEKIQPSDLLAAHTYSQKGVVLWITLVVMVVMLAAALLIVRNTALGQGISGNLAFKKGSVLAGDVGIEVAREWLADKKKKNALYRNETGYFATWNEFADDPNDFDWSKAVEVKMSQTSVTSENGNKVSYLIHRMCKFPGRTQGALHENPGAADKKYLGNQECVYVSGAGNCLMVGCVDTEEIVAQPFYRVTSRTIGPRNTVSYVQAMLY